MLQGRWLVKLLILFMCCHCHHAVAQGSARLAYLLNISGAIGPAAQDYVAKGIRQAAQANAQMVILQIDTPGGLDRSMREIVGNIIRSPLPVIAYVAPSGARAASAGTYILYASHIAAMAPGTNLGAATPVSLGSSSKEGTASEKKAVNDASAYLRSLAQLRHRNLQWADSAVRQGVSLSASEALRLNVINMIASNVNDLLAKLNGKTVTLAQKSVTLNTSQSKVIEFLPDWRTRFLVVITDPNIAYVLLMIGIYGLLFEFMNPGYILPGVAGLISMLVALYAFQLLPINYAGLGLLLLGIVFIVAEGFVPSFGALGIGGIIAFIVGSIMLLDRNTPGFTLLLPVIIAIALLTAALIAVIVQLALKSQHLPIVSGREEMLGSYGNVVIINNDAERPRVRIRGELWQIKSNMPLRDGQRVKVVDLEELILIVTPVEESVSQEGT